MFNSFDINNEPIVIPYNVHLPFVLVIILGQICRLYRFSSNNRRSTSYLGITAAMFVSRTLHEHKLIL